MPDNTSPLDLLVVGDGFIPVDAYRDAIAHLPSESAARLALRGVAMAGDKSEHHAAQAIMEVKGPNLVAPSSELLAAVPGAAVLGLHFAPVGADVIEAGQDLKLISVARAGLENIDITAATARGIGVVPAMGRNAGAVAELQIGLMLSETRNISRADQSIKSGGWRKDFPGSRVEIAHSTVGMVGFGHVGKIFSHRVSGFGPKLIAYDPYASAELLAESGVSKVDNLIDVFEQSDFILVLARLSPETSRFIGKEQFAAMKSSAYFVNGARSRLVDYDALYDVLAAGSISGAALDVFDDEPLPADSRWRSLDNVTMTTHFGGDTAGTNITSARMVVGAAAEFAATGRALEAVNAKELGWA
ncbi:D-3-phosphoglycerate dehydrogenase [Nakamurella sp. UYEF19]|uniref:NAD(P)-dependent oxidoreductase n=1 Tax=Nakamurella sp. UYEF19 TaxID=1756392 RepID=UPI0033974C5D